MTDISQFPVPEREENIVSMEEMIEILRTQGHPGSSFVAFEAVVESSRFRKTGCPVWPIYRRQIVQLNIGYDYEAAVNRQRVREGGEPVFKAGNAMIAYEWDNKFLCHRTNKDGVERHYLYGKRLNTCQSSYEDKDGTVIPFEDIAEWHKKETSYGKQGLNKPQEATTFKLEGIVWISFNGKRYVIMAN